MTAPTTAFYVNTGLWAAGLGTANLARKAIGIRRAHRYVRGAIPWGEHRAELFGAWGRGAVLGAAVGLVGQLPIKGRSTFRRAGEWLRMAAETPDGGGGSPNGDRTVGEIVLRDGGRAVAERDAVAGTLARFFTEEGLTGAAERLTSGTAAAAAFGGAGFGGMSPMMGMASAPLGGFWTQAATRLGSILGGLGGMDGGPRALPPA